MNTFQIIMLLIAAGLILSTFWGSLVQWIKNMQAVEIPVVVEPNWIDNIAVDIVKKKTELMMIVVSWENLKDRCEDAGLDQAVEELNLIWPLLVDADGGGDNVKIN